MQNILLEKEDRMNLRKSFTTKNLASLSFTLNVPSFPKSNEEIHQFFLEILEEIKIYLQAYRVDVLYDTEILYSKETGDFFLVGVQNIPAEELKNITENFENVHILGRFLDLDITDSLGNSVSSHKKKKCFFCGNFPATTCMRNKNHSYTELRDFFLQKIKIYLENKKRQKISKQLNTFALEAILFEVSLTPKVGLVDMISSGSHKDMNYRTFLQSSSALSSYFQELVFAGFQHNSSLPQEALPKIRQIGLSMEDAMFKATNGINTQKGIIFLLGTAIYVSAYLIDKYGYFCIQKFQNLTKNIAKGIVQRELKSVQQPKTHGETAFLLSGEKAAGARAEVESGFEITVNYGLKTLQNLFPAKINVETEQEVQKALFQSLLQIMSVNNDTNILFRKGETILNEFKELAKKCVLDNSEYNFLILSEFCNKNQISAGGSADLLAVATFIYFVENEYNNKL